jgi:hypothetical protein
VSERNGLREWLTTLERTDRSLAAAAFDTRIDRPRVPGSAARGAEKRLRKLGFRIACPSESFYVTGTTGPLIDGETERARRWGEELGRGYLGVLQGTEVAGVHSEDLTTGR